MSEDPTHPTPVTPISSSFSGARARARDDSASAGALPPPPPDPVTPPPAPGTGLVFTQGELATGRLLAGRYRLEAPLATGGMATVWRATDEVLARPVAIKVLHARLAADPDFVARFRREAVAAARLGHPSIVAIYDTCTDPEAIVMELVDGLTLRDQLDRRPLLPPAEAVAIACAIAEALEVAHKAGIVHRDIKPANVLLSADGALKVADFGIAKAANEAAHDPDLPDLTMTGSMVGTAKYLAPEQVSGGVVDARTDVYALGAVLYEMLCGRPPFGGENDLAVATARLHHLPERPRSVLRTIPIRLDEIVMKALATDPERRYASASALWSDLQAAPLQSESGGAVDAAPVDATVIGNAPSFARAERSWLVPAALVSLVALALGLAWILIGGTSAGSNLFGLVDSGGTDDGGSGTPVALSATAFDPFGRDGENDDLAGQAVDGDTATAWKTEQYDTRRLGGLKPGVGLVVDLRESQDLNTLTVTSPTNDWTAEIYVSDTAHATVGDWGAPITTMPNTAAGTTTADLDGARGSFVLIWIVDLGDGNGVSVSLDEVTLSID